MENGLENKLLKTYEFKISAVTLFLKCLNLFHASLVLERLASLCDLLSF